MKAWFGRKKSIFINLSVHLVTVFSLIVLLGGGIYFYSIRQYFTEKIIADNEQILRQTVSTYEVFLDSTIKAAMIYMEGENYHETDYDDSEPAAYDAQIYRRLVNISRITDFIYSIYYFDRDPESIYLSTGLRFDSSDFYDKEFINTLDFSRNYYILPARQLPTLNSGTKDVIPIVINLPLNSTVHNCTYVINMDANRFFNHLIRNSTFDTKRIFKIIDFKGMILASSNNVSDVFRKVEEFNPQLSFESPSGSLITDLNSKKQLLSYYTSAKYDWRYICYVDRDLIFSNMIKPLKITLMIAVVSLVVSIFLALFTSKELYKPIKDIMDFLGEGASPRRNMNEYAIIKHHLNRYLEENQKFRMMLDSNRAALKKQFLYSLVALNVYSEKEIEEKTAYYDISLYNACIVMVIGIDHAEEYIEKFSVNDRLLWDFAMENVAMEILNQYGKGFFVNIESGKFALVLSKPEHTTNEDLEKVAASMAYEIKEAIKSILKFSITIGIGSAKRNLESLYASFKEAVEALRFRESIGTDEVILYKEVVVTTPAIIEYPEAIEQGIIQSLMIGDMNRVEEGLNDLFEQFGRQKGAGSLNLHIFAVRFLNTLVKLIMELGIDESELALGNRSFTLLMAELLKTSNVSECKQIFSDMLQQLEKVMTEKRNNATHEHVNLMIHYISENYNKPISLDIIADYTKLNRCYAGRIFKQYTNMSIVDYVNQVRMKKAVELLDTTDLKVAEISERVGFNNTNYFIKVFKKFMQMTPGQYKEMA